MDLPLVAFDPDCEINYASAYGIEGLGPLLRCLQNDDRIYILKDASGRYYITNLDDSELYVFTEDMTEDQLIDKLIFGISLHHGLKTGRLREVGHPEYEKWLSEIRAEAELELAEEEWEIIHHDSVPDTSNQLSRSAEQLTRSGPTYTLGGYVASLRESLVVRYLSCFWRGKRKRSDLDTSDLLEPLA